MNFYLASLLPQTTYVAHSITDSDGRLSIGSSVTFQTGQIPALPWRQTVLETTPAGADRGVLLGIAGGTRSPRT